MKVTTKLTVFSILLIVVVVVVSCIMVFSFAKSSALDSVYDAGLSDFEQFANDLYRNANMSISGVSKLTGNSYLKYIFRTTYGSEEYVLQAGDAVLCNNTGIDAYRFLKNNGKAVHGDPEARYGYVAADGVSYIVIGQAIFVGSNAYHLSLVRDITGVYTGINALALTCFAFCVALLAVAALCMLLVVRRTMKPLRILQEGVKRVAFGKYDEHIHLSGKNEFSELAESYNEMASAIDSRIAQIQRIAEDRKLLLSSLSHEIKTPVTAIAAYAHSLTHVKMTEEQKAEAIAFINDECLRLERLSGKLMQLISLNDDTMLQFETVPSPKLMEDVRAILSPVAVANDMKLTYLQDPEAKYLLDSDLIVCIITNLFDNARKAGADSVEIGFCKNTIFVADNGCGIPEEKIAKILEPFYKLDASRNTQGFGLGLTLVKRIAQVHRAKLHIESELSIGTKVSFAFQSLHFDDDFAAPSS